jgi:hypothetical protein
MKLFLPHLPLAMLQFLYRNWKYVAFAIGSFLLIQIIIRTDETAICFNETLLSPSTGMDHSRAGIAAYCFRSHFP